MLQTGYPSVAVDVNEPAIDGSASGQRRKEALGASGVDHKFGQPMGRRRRWSAQRTLPARLGVGSAVRTFRGMAGLMIKAAHRSSSANLDHLALRNER
jgi:hypothetical protein